MLLALSSCSKDPEPGKFLVPFKKTLTTRCKGACTNFSSSRKGRPYGRFTLRDEFGRKTEPWKQIGDECSNEGPSGDMYTYL